MRRVCVAVLLVAGSTAISEAGGLSGEELRRFVAGKTVHLDTAIGTIPITYNDDGTLTGKVQNIALRAYLGSETDRGRWQVNGDKICQKFFRWLSGETACVAFRQEGRRISWRRDDGMTGTATIAANDAEPPPPPLGLGLRKDPPLPPPAAMAGHERGEPDVTARPAVDRAVAAVADAADDEPPLIEAPRRIAATHPPVTLAAATASAMPGLGAFRKARAPEPPPPPATTPDVQTPEAPARSALGDLARDLSLQQTTGTWCRDDATPVASVPPLLHIARARLVAWPGEAEAHCLGEEPRLLEAARSMLPR